MAEKMLDCEGGRRSSSHLTSSMYDKDFLELVLQNGEILVQGGSSGRTHRTPSFNIGYSVNPSSHSEETIDHEQVGCIAKRPRLSTLYSVLDMPTATSYENKPTTMDSSQTPSTNSQKQNLGSCEPKTGKVNFSNFSIPQVLVKPTYHHHHHQGNRARSTSNNTEKIEVAAATNCKLAKGSLVFKEQTALTATNNSNPVYVFATSLEQPPPDEHSEAQFCNPTSSSESLRGKERANTNLGNETLVASSSVYSSLGASTNFCSKKHEDTDDSIYLSDNDEEHNDAVKETPSPEDARGKRSRNAETHNLSERKRRDKINKKMRTLKELIPNCNKMDKASMLDDAIEYLKALKLQLQILSMGTGVCMPFMMLPAAAHNINTSNLQHQLMGGGMVFRPGTGIPFSPPQFPIPPLPAITDNRLLQMMFGFPNQVPPMPVSHAPFIPVIGKPSSQPLPEQLTNSTHLRTHQEDSNLNAKAECAPSH